MPDTEMETGGGYEEPAAAADGYDGALTISAADLPNGVKPKVGQKLTFEVVSESDGECELKYAGGADGEDDWEKGAMEAVAPREPTEGEM